MNDGAGGAFRGDKKHAGLLAATERALGFGAERFRGGLRVVARGTALGLPAVVEQWLHADGRSVEEVRSRLGDRRGFDGERGWSIDASGLAVPFELGDLERARLTSAVWSGRWLLPDGELEVGAPVRRGSHDQLAVRLRGGAARFLLTLDGESHLPRVLEPAGGPPWALRFTDYDLTGWCRAARRTVLEQGHLRDELAIEELAPIDEVEAREPASRDAGSDFEAGGGGAITLGFSPRGRLPLVRPRLDGREVGAFLLDTGAGALGIDAGVADRLGLASFGRSWVVTADGGTGACFREAGRLQLGPLGLRAPLFVELDLGELGRALGVELAGVVGYDLLARGRFAIEGEPRRLLVRAPEEAAPADDGGAMRWVPLAFEERRPLLACEAEGGALRLALDTASSSTVTLYAEAVRALGLEASTRAGARIRGASGARGVAQRRLKWLAVGGETFAEVRAVLTTAREGIGGTPGRHGTVGWGLLKHLDLVLDYPRRRLGLRRRPG